jgi:hypothetical protein
MPILNFTTKIDAWKTVNEIQQILSKHGITHINIKNEGSMPIAVSFTIMFRGQPLNFLLPCNHEGVFKALKNDRKVPHSSKTMEQAVRTSWRIIKDWVQAQMAIVEADISPIEEVFLNRLLDLTGERTLSDIMFKGEGMKLLNN